MSYPSYQPENPQYTAPPLASNYPPVAPSPVAPQPALTQQMPPGSEYPARRGTTTLVLALVAGLFFVLGGVGFETVRRVIRVSQFWASIIRA